MVDHYRLEAKRENFNWKVRKNIYDHGTVNIGARKERIKTGYCEYCHKRYSDIKVHVSGEQHKSYVQGTNFKSLDKVINCFTLDRCCPLPEVIKNTVDFSGHSTAESCTNNGDGDDIVDFYFSPEMEGVVPMKAVNGGGVVNVGGGGVVNVGWW